MNTLSTFLLQNTTVPNQVSFSRLLLVTNILFKHRFYYIKVTIKIFRTPHLPRNSRINLINDFQSNSTCQTCTYLRLEICIIKQKCYFFIPLTTTPLSSSVLLRNFIKLLRVEFEDGSAKTCKIRAYSTVLIDLDLEVAYNVIWMYFKFVSCPINTSPLSNSRYHQSLM